jgi:hypothetical protein
LDIPLHSQPVAEIRWDGSHHVLTASSWALRVEVNGTRTREAVLEPGSTLRVADATFEFVHEPNDEPSY